MNRTTSPVQVLFQDAAEGLWRKTPPLFSALGMCPALAVTTGAVYGLTMGLATAFVLVGGAVVISALRRFIPHEVRIPIYTIAVATLVTVADLVLAGWMPAIHRILGVFVPLIIVNCIILGRIEAFTSRHSPMRALADAAGYGMGFTWALTLVGAIREVLGAGTLFGVAVMPEGFVPLAIMRTPPGAFLTMGFLVAALTALSRRRTEEQRERRPLPVGARPVAMDRAEG